MNFKKTVANSRYQLCEEKWFEYETKI